MYEFKKQMLATGLQLLNETRC